MHDSGHYWNGGQNAQLLGWLMAKVQGHDRSYRDHEARLRKIETRLTRGAIIAALATSGVGLNLSAEQIAELIVRVLAGLGKGG